MSPFFMNSGPMMSMYSWFASGSAPGTSAIDCSVIAASGTDLTIGPAVSCDASVRAMPTANASPPAAEAADPEEDPLGPSAASIALSTCPVRLLKPDGWLPKLLAHSDRPALPRMIRPCARSSLATPESLGGNDSRSAQSPAEVYIGVASMMSLD